ncbi:bifunctional phosphoribosyl-AMP cyclohydrolase/phosphoribosyl-ATP diphosphatase HisIE [Cytobacillus gottheilii]|uniref:bifunctional phosphoribosyl-AMP cyclohydrolase/phosphoribosyl-ATP diphosphatase HisIE n=1 Tax=Cytobacillus gottheilii TaxID=859144 RepID=UPI0009BA06DF|nr:bifunctional phosphoribosyl-AMP cyclohydrolase/phosphoribosyl-ATP diphosphatase HisIE [Cytobacillus gottheilii]
MKIVFDGNGLIPAIVQHAETKEVLTLAYMNEESYKKSLETGETWFYSRSRQELWHKGATSGNTQKIVEMKLDCDQDALVVLVQPAGPACHKGTESCFEESVYKGEALGDAPADYSILGKLEKVIRDREAERPEGAYTTYLFEKGVDKILKKVGEEASEVIIAAKNRDKEELKWESADLLYHLLVLLREQDLPFGDVLKVLEKRHEKPAAE